MFNYFVSYDLPTAVPPCVGNIDVSLEGEIDSYRRVTEIEEVIATRLRSQGHHGVVVVKNWILLRQTSTAPDADDDLGPGPAQMGDTLTVAPGVWEPLDDDGTQIYVYGDQPVDIALQTADRDDEARQLQAEIARLRAELGEGDALRNRMAGLLNGVADGLKGEPPPLVMHDWSDLPALAAAMREKLRVLAGGDPAPAPDEPPFRVGDIETLLFAAAQNGGATAAVPAIPSPALCVGCGKPAVSLWSDGSVWCAACGGPLRRGGE